MKSVLSLDIGKQNVHIVEGSHSKNNIQIERAQIVPVPEGSMNGPTIVNPELLAESLEKGIRLGGFLAKEAILTLDAPWAVVRDLTLPMAKPKETSDMVKAEMLQTYKISPTDVIQYKTIPASETEATESLIHFRAAALNNALIEGYRNLLLALKLRPIAMDLNFNAIDKIFASGISVGYEQATILVDLGDSLTTVYIGSKDRAGFFRHLEFGCGDIERIIAQETFVPETDIRRLKEQGFDFFGAGEEAQRYMTALRPLLYNLTDEMQRIIGFYTSRNSGMQIERMLLFGGGSSLSGLISYFENSFGVPAQQIKALSNVTCKDPGIPIWRHLNAIGAILRNSY